MISNKSTGQAAGGIFSSGTLGSADGYRRSDWDNETAVGITENIILKEITVAETGKRTVLPEETVLQGEIFSVETVFLRRTETVFLDQGAVKTGSYAHTAESMAAADQRL